MDRISIILLCHNNRDIDICAMALIKQMQRGDELLVVDDHSDEAFISEKVIPLLQMEQEIHLLRVEARTGNRAYNRNFGAHHAHNPILLFVDGDMVLCEHSLGILRRAYASMPCVAFIGSEHGTKYSDLHISLHLGNINYRDFAETLEGRAFLRQHPLLADWRERELSSPEFSPYYWIYFYTSFCSMKRAAFNAIGGFDEAFITWGSEDVDIGYRLSQYGEIGYLPGMSGLHMPHTRNIWEQESCDRDNIRYILDKYRVWQIELLAAFDSSCELYKQMEDIYNVISHLELLPLSICPEPNSLWIDLPYAGVENQTTQWFSSTGELSQAPLLGIALPFCENRFQSAYLSSNIFAYPSVLTARILMESIRVSKNVYICPVAKAYRQKWADSSFSQLTSLHHVCAISTDIMEYQFTKLENGLIEVLSPQNKKRLADALCQTTIFPNAQTRQRWAGKFPRDSTHRYTLVNMTTTDSSIVREKLENALGIFIGPIYDFSGSLERIVLGDRLPLALCQNPTPLLYIVPDAEKISKAPHWQRDLQDDLIFDLTGTLYTCGELNLTQD